MILSANLGFLWADRPLPDAIRAAGAAGFDAVECHWPQDVPATEVRAALAETNLPMLCLNTRRGRVDAGEFGLSALPGREREARAAIDEALACAGRIGARNVHVMAGIANGRDAQATFRANIAYACEMAAPLGIGILIEPINPHDVPGYALSTTSAAADLIRDLDHPALRLMFDCYHVAWTERDVCARLADIAPLIGHVQIAAVPDRGAPDHGDLDYATVFETLDRIGYGGAVGAEYRPDGDTDASLGWLRAIRG